MEQKKAVGKEGTAQKIRGRRRKNTKTQESTQKWGGDDWKRQRHKNWRSAMRKKKILRFPYRVTLRGRKEPDGEKKGERKGKKVIQGGKGSEREVGEGEGDGKEEC